MGADSDIEALLREYLKRTPAALASKEDVRDVAKRVDRLAERFEEYARTQERRLGLLTAKVETNERAVDRLEEAAEVTGVHTVAELRERYRELKSQNHERARFWRGWFGGIAATGIGGAVSFAVAKLFGG